MKKLILLASAGLFLATSCRKDDDDNPQDLLVGTWTIEKYVVEYGNGTTESDAPTTCTGKSNLIFGSDGKYTSNDYYDSGSNCDLESNIGTYSYDNNTSTLTVSANGASDNSKIEKLTNSQLIILFGESDFDDDGKTDKQYIYYKK
ncbi:lipocalin family protein [Epilithonimonas sp. JDS]|uniref:lipocalin family protein n=1 Tax=Epilithonimonas sp. JDS TaxID=2902797 RepID=UPI001E33246D|nr:lipocalin family protein [Epilithonimonas sp. JDS]MCD9853152.1 lipocalin family protein [Epilithonimonas sp. JDS]